MTLREINETAFGKYLNAFPTPGESARYVWSCLYEGDSSSMAWDLMSAAHGADWKFQPSELPRAIVEAVHKLNDDLHAEISFNETRKE